LYQGPQRSRPALSRCHRCVSSHGDTRACLPCAAMGGRVQLAGRRGGQAVTAALSLFPYACTCTARWIPWILDDGLVIAIGSRGIGGGRPYGVLACRRAKPRRTTTQSSFTLKSTVNVNVSEHERSHSRFTQESSSVSASPGPARLAGRSASTSDKVALEACRHLSAPRTQS
jgi:hypothetical protein